MRRSHPLFAIATWSGRGTDPSSGAARQIGSWRHSCIGEKGIGWAITKPF
jgi:hypothetical protein